MVAPFRIFGQEVKISKAVFAQHVASLRRSDELSKTTENVGEQELLEMLAVEKNSKDRVFVIERLYIKYKKARERREKVELLTTIN